MYVGRRASWIEVNVERGLRRRFVGPFVEPGDVLLGAIDRAPQIVRASATLLGTVHSAHRVDSLYLCLVLRVRPQLMDEAIIGCAVVVAILGGVALPQSVKLSVLLRTNLLYDLCVATESRNDCAVGVSAGRLFLSGVLGVEM